MHKKSALQFGAGNIGRGLSGYILNKNNYYINFIDINKDLIYKLNNEKLYTITELENEKESIVTIENFNGINLLKESKKIINLIAKVDLIFISIGINNLDKIKQVIQEGLILRNNLNNNILNIIALENGIKVSDILKNKIYENLNKATINNLEKNVSFVNSVVDRIVPNQNSKNLNVIVEKEYEIVLDKSTWKGEKLNHVSYSENLEMYMERKLFMLNGIHALIAWLEIKKDIKYIYEFQNFENIKLATNELFIFYKNVLSHKYNFLQEDLDDYQKKVIKRLSNSKIKDSSKRVGRGAIRKLSQNERFLSPFNYALKNNIDCTPIFLALAICFTKLDYQDEEYLEIQQFIKNNDLEKAIKKYLKFKDKKLIEILENEILKNS